MSDSLLMAHLDALEAQVGMLQAQVRVIRQLVTPPSMARLSVPERCEGYDAHRCAMQDDSARISRASFADPNAWQCVGCRFRESGLTSGDKQE